MEARHVKVSLTYNSKDISQDISEHLLSFTYTDNSGKNADDISVTLEDREGLWRNEWWPDKGATLTAMITVYNWNGAGQVQTLPCGTFEIDQIDCSMPPSKVTIKAISARVTGSVRQEAHTRAWEGMTLSGIAGDVASENNLELMFDSDDDPQFDRLDQVEMSDIVFLSDLCMDNGVAVKITDDKLVCYSEEKYEAKEPIGEIKPEDVISARFTSKTNNIYKAAKVTYHDPVTTETVTGQALGIYN